MYDQDTVYIVGDARTQEDNPITYKFSKFFIALVVSKSSGEIIDFQCSSTLDITNRFLSDIFIGKSLNSDYDKIEKELERRYFGASKKAILVALKDAIKKYNSIRLGKLC
jgi:hypothetical protein